MKIDGKDVEVFEVPIDGATRSLALIKPGRQRALVDPDQPDTPIVWEGNWRTLEQSMPLDPQFDNFPTVAEEDRLRPHAAQHGGDRQHRHGRHGDLVDVRGLRPVAVPHALQGRHPRLAAGDDHPAPFVTLVPTYIMYNKLGWIGTFLPLTVPHFFANAYNVFLMRRSS